MLLLLLLTREERVTGTISLCTADLARCPELPSRCPRIPSCCAIVDVRDAAARLARRLKHTAGTESDWEGSAAVPLKAMQKRSMC